MKDLLSQDTLNSLSLGATTEKLNQGRKPMGFLDSVMFALSGTPDQLLTPEDAQDRGKRRKEAGGMAKGAHENPGEEFMGAPNLGGSGVDLGEMIRLGMKLLG
jgi:hypothetical protein